MQNFQEILKAELEKPVALKNQPGATIDPIEAMVKSVMTNAMKGDLAAISFINTMTRSTDQGEDERVRSEEHPTMKPVGLFAYLIANSTTEGEVVLDSFAGSGTTIVACEQMHRKGMCMELDPHYCDVIIARWEKMTGQKAVKVE